jgi:DNA helicase HerA-like ATPase
MRFIGRVADEATDTSATVILVKEAEKEVCSEEIVLIENGGEKKIGSVIGVLRRGLGKNELLNISRYRPDIAYMKYGGEPSGSREVFSFNISIIGSVDEGKIRANRRIIAPRSPVYLFDENENPLEKYIAPSAKRLGWLDAHLDGHPSWKVPADAQYIPYHVGVFGATGTGKSWFTRHVLIPFYMNNGYKVIVLDWSGEDYSPYFESVHISEIAQDELSIMEYFSKITEGFGRNDNVKDAFDEYVMGWEEKVRGREPSSVYEELKRFVYNHLEEIKRDDWRNSALRAANRVFRRLKPEHITPLMGTMHVEKLIERKENPIVVDMSGFSSSSKLSFFLSLSSELQRMMIGGMDLKMALVIDEAPQYCPFKPEGMQIETTEAIKNLAALGRKHDLNLTLIAQGIAGEIGINAAVRRNLNTNFYGRLHPLDAAGEGGAKDWLGPFGITPEYLLNLEDGRFYFAGIMNPSPIPLLITFEVR